MSQIQPAAHGNDKKRFFLPVILTIIFLSAYGLRDQWIPSIVDQFTDQIAGIYLLGKVLIGSILMLGCWTILSLLDRFVWHGDVIRRTGHPVPKLLTQIVSVSMLLVTAMALLVVVFEQSLLLVALSIGGFALLVVIFFRDMLEDMLAGIAINLDPTLYLGDIITLPGGRSGRLNQITWRSTTLLADDGSVVIAPNRTVSTSVLVNYSAGSPDRAGRKQIDVSVVMDYSVSVERVVRILEGAMASLAAQDRILAEPAPIAFASAPTSYGIEYIVRFFYNTTNSAEETVRTAVVSELMRHLRSSGLDPSLPKQNLFLGEVRMRNMEWLNPVHRETLIAGFSIFSSLETDELAELASSIILHDVKKGATIIQQDDEGTSMFGLAEGYLEVEVTVNNLEKLRVGEIVPGQFFGEMSMLVGEPRGATVTAGFDSVVFEITRAAFEHIVEKRPETANQISRVIAERQLANTAKLEATAADRESAIGEAADNLFSRMKSVFKTLGR